MTAWATIRLIAAREIRERLRARSFKISTLISALVIAAIIIVPSMQDESTPHYRVVVSHGADAELLRSIEKAGPQTGAIIEARAAASAEAATAAVEGGRADIALTATGIVVDGPLSDARPGARERVIAAISQIARVRGVLDETGVDPEVAQRILTSPGLPVTSLQPDQSTPDERIAGFLGVVILFAFLQQYGSWIAYGVAEEKTSRVVEVLLAATRPTQLLAGKVAGIGIAAVLQGTILAGTAYGSMLIAGSGLPSGVDAGNIVAPLAWFILGYAFYCWAYAAAASLVSRTSDLPSTMFPVTLPILIGYFVAVTASFSTDPSIVAKVLAFLPPTAPMLMLMLSANGEMQQWQVLVSAGTTVVATVLLARVAGGIYARSILRTGKRVGWREAFRSSTG